MSKRAKVGDWVRSKSTPTMVAQVVYSSSPFSPHFVLIEYLEGRNSGEYLRNHYRTDKFKPGKMYEAVFKYDIIPTPSLLLEDLL